MNISYMGSKRAIAPYVADAVSFCKDGPLLDIFSGTCCVGKEVAPKRQIWCNDIQYFSSNVAMALFASQHPPVTDEHIFSEFTNLYQENYRELSSLFEAMIVRESALLNDQFNLLEIQEFYQSILPKIHAHPRLINLSKSIGVFPYHLFFATYSGTYIGLNQAIQVDSIKYAIDLLLKKGCINYDQQRWLVLAMCHALSKISTITGHFAQYLSINNNNQKKFIYQRKRSAFAEMLQAHNSFKPIGNIQWRSKNKIFQMDCDALLKKMIDSNESPSVIYADPPYTEDQYSRYYHLYETAILYDYPETSGKARYRNSRFRSNYSLKSQIKKSMLSLIRMASETGADFVLSYPNNGILRDAKSIIIDGFNKSFSKTDFLVIEHQHSSMGGSSGFQKQYVSENIYIGRNL